MVASKERARSIGMRVVLKVAPVDPKDYMSGRYIQITPAIARLDPAKVPVERGGVASSGAGPTREGAADSGTPSLLGHVVFFELTRDGDVWDARRVVVDGSGVEPRRPFLRARVDYSPDTSLRLDYSLDRFYIPADGHDPSFLAFDSQHSVKVVLKVPSDGAGVIEDLLVDEKTWKEWDAEERAKEK
jgi:uncharacterized membrane-anchored protein